MAGVVDDLEESINEVLRALDHPVSVVIVKVGNQDEMDAQNLVKQT